MGWVRAMDDDVDILDATALQVLDHCHGPTAGTLCSRPSVNGVVACAGHRILPMNASPEYSLLWVPPGTGQCPLAWNLEAVGM